MRYEYVVYLKRDSRRAVDATSILLCCFSALSLLFDQIHPHHFNYFFSGVAVVLLGGVGTNILLARRGRVVRYKFLLLLAALGWLAMPYLQWLSVPLVLSAFLEYQAKRPLEIGFSPDSVVVNSLWRRRFVWSAFNNVILKDGLLTLDFRNNRLLQKEVDEEEEGDAEEDEFNAFCQGRLREAGGPGGEAGRRSGEAGENFMEKAGTGI
ncbi:MAG: hypothetical protein Q8927_00945 [Bacteroidota bacterium]|nr:hypothetical protein [Bacteroidota bacterium]MDP4214734.1 hypothetical protein [Bacteroidota bacterium]MDP4248148.1 hypothetical protein [Bacteroidota bacterium]MDP4253289.1 hypothetical protein [Bacteroidota bacterium]MDP4257677.1 hypothetical protein [Bacteroidota bacterium]